MKFNIEALFSASVPLFELNASGEAAIGLERERGEPGIGSNPHAGSNELASFDYAPDYVMKEKKKQT